MAASEKSLLKDIFEVRFRDSYIWCQLTQMLSIQDFCRLSAVSTTVRAWAQHRLQHRRLSAAAVSARLVGRKEMTLTKDASDEVCQLIRDDIFEIRIAVERSTEQSPSSILFNGQHWVAFFRREGGAPWEGAPTPSVYQLHVHTQGRQPDSVPVQQHFLRLQLAYHPHKAKLTAAWGRLYLAVISNNRDPGPFFFQLYSLTALSKPRLIRHYQTERRLDWTTAELRDPFHSSIDNDELRLSCLAMTGKTPWLLSITVERVTEKTRAVEELVELAVDLGPHQRYVQGRNYGDNLSLLGLGRRFMALAVRPAVPAADVAFAYGRALPWLFRDTQFDAAKPGLLLLLERVAGLWKKRCAFHLPGIVPCFTSNGNVSLSRWMRPAMLEEGLRVEDFVSGQHWFHVDDIVYTAPSI